ncbi:MAG TPA: hypothetical protein VEO96_04465 [Thermoplasmata archaeon]|nr:hypothetical protein [Thermoplasmata archaeon]
MYPPSAEGPKGATMCDEYYDARMRAFWRALAEEEADEELEAAEDDPIVKPIAIETLEPRKAKPKALLH